MRASQVPDQLGPPRRSQTARRPLLRECRPEGGSHLSPRRNNRTYPALIPTTKKWPGNPAIFIQAVDRWLLSARNRHVVAPRRAGVELARAADLLARILDHLLPLRDPADC